MKPVCLLPSVVCLGLLLAAPTVPGGASRAGDAGSDSPQPPQGFVSLFDGKTLDGWHGDRTIWSVRDGAITGQTSAQPKLTENNFLIWKDEVEDFELRLKFRLESGNSGIYYRARKRPPGQTKGDPLVGTQADFDASGRWTGVIMEYLLRDVLAERGQKVVIDQSGKRQVVGSTGDPAQLLAAVKPRQWNDYTVIARGGRAVLKINGVTMCELDDRDPRRLKRGGLGLQVHVGPPMVVQFKDIYLRKLSSGAEPASTAEPSAYLYDAPEASVVPLSEERLSTKSGWSRLAEDDTAHRFEGCAVLANDKIVAVLRKETPSVDLYSRQTQGLKLCARLQPVCGGSADLKPASLAVKENSRSVVSLEAGLRSPRGETRQITYELTAGTPFIKTTAGPGVEKLRVQAPCRFAVLPDFFGDDMVVDASTIPVPRAELPSENFLLHMVHGGEAILMTVSGSRDNDVGIALSDRGRVAGREIVSSDISYGKKPQIWIAVLAGKGIWHQHAVAAADAGNVIGLDWKMPFAALWRVDWSTADKMTDSWEMLLQHPDGKYVMQGWFGQDESEGQRFGKEFGPRDWNKSDRRRWNPVLGSFVFPCWIDNDGRGYLQPLKERRYAERGKVYNFAGPAIIYPIDRVKVAPFHTPIESLTVVDLVRMTLGVGPCQYILDLEGQKRNSQGVATCYGRDVINAIYERGAQLQNRGVIEEHLAATVAFIRNVRERIDVYVKFGHEMSAYLEEQKRRDPRHAEFLDELLLVTGRLDQLFEANRERIRTPAYADQNAESFREKLLTYTGKDAYQKCAAEMAVFTSIGGAQDGLVASCRMIAKTLRQRSGIAMAADPGLKDIATEIRARTQAVLRNPTAYEAPRH